MKKYLFLSYLLQICMSNLLAQPLAAPKNVKGNNDFAFDFYQEISQKDRENIIYSPFSIRNAVAITYAGAKGKTAEEIATVFYFPQANETLYEQINEQIISTQRNVSTSFEMVNKLWFTEKMSPKEEFLTLCNKYYQGNIEAIDFEGSDLARKTMNNWVSNSTEQKINQLLPQGAITPLTRLVVMNAVYFKGDWQNSFDAAKTEDKDFYSENRIPQKVPFMKQENTFRFLSNDSLQVIELPYKDEKYSMLIFLPNKQNSFSEFESNFTIKSYDKLSHSLSQQKVNVCLPKFSISPEKGYELKATLKNMGIQQAFEENADFSGIFNTDESISLSNIFHKGFISVDETGTEAAAGTAAVMLARGIDDTPIFYANHPFIFLIKDTRTGNIMFMGRVMNLE